MVSENGKARAGAEACTPYGRASALLGRVAIILVSPRVPENIGAAARALKNFTLSDLRLVRPREYDHERALRTARDGRDVLEAAGVFESITEAASDLTCLCAASARTGADRADRLATPPAAMERLLDIGATGLVGVLFGPEERGLTNRELDLCSSIVTIRANPEFSSLNLAQAVVLVCHHLFEAALRRSGPIEGSYRSTTVPESSRAAETRITAAAGSSQSGQARCDGGHPAESTPGTDGAGGERAATLGEIEGFFEQARSFLVEAGFLNPQNPDAVLLHLRKLLARARPSSHEVKILRGIVRQVSWYAENGKKE